MIYIILIYLIGCLLSFGRITAKFFEIEERYLRYEPFLEWWLNPVQFKVGMKYTLLSWIGLSYGIYQYHILSEWYLFKFSYNALKEKK